MSAMRFRFSLSLSDVMSRRLAKAGQNDGHTARAIYVPNEGLLETLILSLQLDIREGLLDTVVPPFTALTCEHG